MTDDPFIYHEEYLVSYCLIYPEFTNLFDIDIIENESYHNLLRLIKESKQKDVILPSHIAGWVKGEYEKEGIMKIHIDSLYNITRTFVLQEKRFIENDFKATLTELEKRDFSKNTIITLEKAQIEIQSGHIEKGITMAKSIKFPESKETLTGIAAIIEACKESTPVIQTGLNDLDNLIGGFTRGNLITNIGDTGSMKTMFSMFLCIKILKKNPELTCNYFEKEMPVKDIAIRLMAYELEINLEKIIKADSLKGFADKFIEKLNDNPDLQNLYNRLKIIPPNNFSDAYDVRSIVEENKPDIWCLDFFMMMDNKKNKEPNIFAKEQSEILKSTANITNSVGIILNQLKADTIDGRINKIPRRSDSVYGSQLSQVSQINIANFYPANYYNVYNNKKIDEHYFYVIFHKSRNSGVHKLGQICFRAHPEQCFFEESSGDYKKLMMEWLQFYKSRKDKYDNN